MGPATLPLMFPQLLLPQKQRSIHSRHPREGTGRDLCKTPPFAQFRRQAQILILEIFNIFLRLKFSPSLDLNKIWHFSKVSGNAVFDLQVNPGAIQKSDKTLNG
jgi:hypothetical protein